MMLRLLLVPVVFLVILGSTGLSAASEPPGDLFRQGLEAHRRGAFADAVGRWEQAASAYEQQGDRGGQEQALRSLAEAHMALGQSLQAVARLETALALAVRSADAGRLARVRASLGNAQMALGRPDVAEVELRTALGLARTRGEDLLTATILNDLGNVVAQRQRPGEALTLYEESARLAGRGGHRVLAARAHGNAALALRQTGRPGEARDALDAALDQLRPAPPSHEVALSLVQIGVGYRTLRPSHPDTGDVTRRAGEALDAAAQAADALGDRRTASYAWGYLGALYEDEGRAAEALQLTRRAILAAQQVDAPESLYRWQWQAGRLLRALGSTDDAVASYRRAVQTVQSIRPELSSGPAAASLPFRASVGRVYFELVDLLLREASARKGREEVTPYLVEARDIVELFKAAELRDYFRDDCVDVALSRAARLDVVSQTAVVVYPIILPDRTELLVSLPNGLKSVVVPVGEERLTQEVRQFRRRLEKRTTREYLPHAQQLYDWLIRPLAADLAGLAIDTLVFVPDGSLRTIPMAALHDGSQFLISKYAVAVTPGLSLTDPRPMPREHLRILAGGVTRSVQGFAPLPQVALEIEELRALFPTIALLDEEFVASAFERRLRREPFNIVHIASHGQFGGDVEQTFLLTFDGRLTMDRLDQVVGLLKYREEPLELLTLSACDTAEGDDRAALGLAGVAVKAGARSALATLWHINDEATARVVIDFYRALREPSVSRAAALRRAQLRMLEDQRHEHPGFWSPYLLINNWL